jgi:hypothetical protein
MAVVVVGDAKTIEPGLRQLAELGPLTELDARGRPATASATSADEAAP